MGCWRTRWPCSPTPAHMLTDAGAIGFSLLALRLAARPARGAMTFGFKRAEILSAQANGRDAADPCRLHPLRGAPPAGRPSPRAAAADADRGADRRRGEPRCAWSLARADRRSLNIEGSFQHVLTDLYAFIGTALAAARDPGDRLPARRSARLAADRRADAPLRLRAGARLRADLPGGGARRAWTRSRSAWRWSPSPAWWRCTTCTCGRSAAASPRSRRTCSSAQQCDCHDARRGMEAMLRRALRAGAHDAPGRSRGQAADRHRSPRGIRGLGLSRAPAPRAPCARANRPRRSISCADARILVGVLGGALVALMLLEIFVVFLLPRRVKRDPRIVRSMFNYAWRPWRRLARTLPCRPPTRCWASTGRSGCC